MADIFNELPEGPEMQPRPIVFGRIVTCSQLVLLDDNKQAKVVLVGPATKVVHAEVQVPLNGCYFKLGKRYHVLIREEPNNADE